MTDRHTFSSTAEKLHSVHRSFRIALKVMTTVTDGAFNLVCLHDNGDTVYVYYMFAGFADLNHSNLFTNNHVIICKESHVI